MIRAIERPDAGEFLTLSNESGQVIVLDRKKAEATRADVLRTYRVPEDRSPDLRDDVPGAAREPAL